MSEATIEEITITTNLEDLVLETVDDVERVLRTFISNDFKPGEEWHKSDITTGRSMRNTMTDRWREILDTSEIGYARVEEKLQLMLTSLRESDRGNMRGDHPEGGTPFFKTGANAKKVGDRYLLYFSCAGGYDINKDLAQKLSIPQALKNIQINAYLTMGGAREITYDFEAALKRLHPIFLQPNRLTLTENTEFRGFEYLNARINDNVYFMSIRFEGTPLCGVVNNKMTIAVREGTRPYLQVTIMPAEICKRDGLIGKMQVLGGLDGLYLDREIKPVQLAAECVKNLIPSP